MLQTGNRSPGRLTKIVIEVKESSAVLKAALVEFCSSTSQIGLDLKEH